MENDQDQDGNEENPKGKFVKKLRAGGRRITLKYAGTCADCSAELAVGETARWYGRGRIYGLSCHAEGAKPQPKPQAQMDFGEKKETEPVEPAFDPGEVGTVYDCTIH